MNRRFFFRALSGGLTCAATAASLMWSSYPADARRIHGGITSGAAPAGQITTLVLNNASATETPMWSKMFGHCFADNDVTGCPLSGGNPTYPTFKIGATTYGYSMSEPSYWPSGRIKHAMFVLLLGGLSMPGSTATTFDVTQGGTSKPTPSSRSLSDLTTADIKSVVTFMDGATGSYTASLNDGIISAFSDNITVADGAAGKVVRVRASYRDGGGVVEGMTENYFYVFIGQDSSGNFGGIKVQSCIATPWGDATPALRCWKSFSAATFQTGATVIRDNVTSGRSNTGTCVRVSGSTMSCAAAPLESWTAVRFTTTGTLPAPLVAGTTYFLYCGTSYVGSETAFQIYTQSGSTTSNQVTMTNAGSGVHTYTIYPWVTCYGRLFLCGTTGEWDFVRGGGSVTGVSTYVDTHVQVRWNKVYASSTLVVPAYDFNAAVTPGIAQQFFINTNCGLTNEPNSGGIDEHLGLLPTPMVRHIYTQSLVDERNVRAIGLAGGQINQCIRQIANGFHISSWNRGHNGTNATYTGMGTNFYQNRFGPSSGTTNIFLPLNAQSFANMTGQFSGEASHRTAYNWYPYIMTGQPEYLDMLIETANCAPMSAYNGGSSPTFTTINTSVYAPLGTPAINGSNSGSRNVTTSGVTRYGVFCMGASQRQDAWQIRDTGICAGIIPQAFPECLAYFTYFNDLVNDNMSFINAIIALSPTAYSSSSGLFWPQGGVYYQDLWQAAYYTEAASMVYGLTQNSQTLAILNALNKWLGHVVNTFGVVMISLEEVLIKQSLGSGGGGPLINSDDQLGFCINSANTTWSNTVNPTQYTFSVSTSGVPFPYTPAIGDQIYFTTPDPPSQNTDPIPGALTAFQGYYIVSVAGTFPNFILELSATPGGTPITNTDSSGVSIIVWPNPKSPVTGIGGNNGPSDYPTVIYRSMLLSKSRGAIFDPTAEALMAAVQPSIAAYAATPTYCFSATA